MTESGFQYGVSVNGTIGSLKLVAGMNMTITQSGTTFTFASTGGGSGVTSLSDGTHASTGAIILKSTSTTLDVVNTSGTFDLEINLTQQNDWTAAIEISGTSQAGGANLLTGSSASPLSMTIYANDYGTVAGNALNLWTDFGNLAGFTAISGAPPENLADQLTLWTAGTQTLLIGNGSTNPYVIQTAGGNILDDGSGTGDPPSNALITGSFVVQGQTANGSTIYNNSSDVTAGYMSIVANDNATGADGDVLTLNTSESQSVGLYFSDGLTPSTSSIGIYVYGADLTLLGTGEITTGSTKLNDGSSNMAVGGLFGSSGGGGAVSTITVTASPFQYTNSSVGNQEVFIGGGTVTALQLNGDFISGGVALPPGLMATVIIRPSDTLTVSYTLTPVLTYITL